MFRTALRNVLAHKARLLMTVLAVMLGVSFVSGTLVFSDTIGNAFKNKSAKSFDHVSVAIRPGFPSGAPGETQEAKKKPVLTDALLKKAQGIPGAASVVGDMSGFTALADKNGKLVGQDWGTTGANFFPDANGKDARYSFTAGQAPKRAGEIAVDSRTAERTGYKVGESARLSTDGPVTKQTITGIFDTSNGNVVAGGSLVLFDNTTAPKVLAKTEYDEIDVKAAAGTSQAALKSAVEKILPKDTEAVTGATLAADQEELINKQTDSLSQALLYFAGISLFVGIFIIANTFTMLVAQRTKELALMRAIGASRRQVTRSVLIEALIVGVIAAVTGFAVGIGIAIGLRSVVNAIGGSLPDGPLVVAPMTAVIALIIGVVVTMLAAWLPGRRAARIPPIAAMNSVHASPTVRGLVVRNTIGSVIAALGTGALFMGVSVGGQDGMPYMGLGAGLILIGVIVLTPLLSRPFIAAMAPLLKPFGVTGKLARQNSLRNPRRTASTAAALMIGLTLITAMTVVALSVQSAINKMATDALKSDYTISMANYQPLSPTVAKKLAALPDVAASSPMRSAWGEIDGGYTNINGVDEKGIGKLLSLDFTSGSLDGLTGSTTVVDKETADEQGLTPGDTTTVKFDDGKSVKLKVIGVYQPNEMISGLFTPTAVVDPHLETVADQQVLVKMKDGASAKAENTIVKALGENPAIKIQDKEAISDEIGGAINLMLNMLYGLLGMAVLIAVLGVINTLAMSVFERKHEIGMLRAIGLDRSKVKLMVRLEAVVISLFGAALGVGLGIFLGWAAGSGISETMKTYTMEIPVVRIAVFLVAAALVGVLAAMWPARSAARLNPLAAIKAE